MNILVVDDEHLLCWTLTQVFNEAGWTTTCCASAIEAMNLLRTTGYDLVITDLRIPDGDGIDVAACAKSYFPTPFVVLLTAESKRGTSRLQSEHVDEIIEKPFDIEALVESIKKYHRPKKTDTTKRLKTQDQKRSSHHHHITGEST